MEKQISKQEIEKQKQYIKILKKNIVKEPMYYYIDTMGCQLNENDSEKLEGMLQEMGYKKTNEPSLAKIAIFNTCCIRENAESKVFGKIGSLKKYKEKGMIIAICGCMPQEKHIIDKIKLSYNFIDIIFGTHTLYKFPELLYNALSSKTNVIDVLDIEGQIAEGLPVCHKDKYRANVTIMYGCNNFCSYCIVPYVRGRERSRNMCDILEEITNLAKHGYKEITLLGQNVNSYGNDLEDKNCTFANLLYEIQKIEGIELIKFISPHPKDFTDDVIKAIKQCDKVHKVIHLPLQSGSSKILKSMNRKYTKEQYLQLVEDIRSEINDATFTTDIIVGFPGESEEDFEDTLDVIRKVGFEQVYMFIYSRRIGTVADKMENQISQNVKSDRFARLKNLSDSLIAEKSNDYVGTIQNILVEGYSKNNKEMLTGRTSNGKIVVFKGNSELIGKNVDIRIISSHAWYLLGELKV